MMIRDAIAVSDDNTAHVYVLQLVRLSTCPVAPFSASVSNQILLHDSHIQVRVVLQERVPVVAPPRIEISHQTTVNTGVGLVEV